jgi:hypothetical protein
MSSWLSQQQLDWASMSLSSGSRLISTVIKSRQARSICVALPRQPCLVDLVLCNLLQLLFGSYNMFVGNALLNFVLPCEGSGSYALSDLRASLAISPSRSPAAFFFHPDGGIRPSRVSGSSFSSGFGLSSIRRAQAIPDFPRRARGLRTKQKRAKRRAGPRCRRQEG